MIKAVIFDLDGTLVNSLADLCDSTNFALRKHGLETHPLEEFKYLVGDGMKKLIERAIGDNVDEESYNKVFNDFMSNYREHYLDKTKPYDDIERVLLELKSLGLKFAVVSNKADDMAKILTKKLFGDIFVEVVGKRENYPLKPDPTLTLEVISNMECEPKECIFVGDSGMDMANAKNANCVALGVLWGFRKRQELIDNGAEYLAQNPQEMLNIIKSQVK